MLTITIDGLEVTLTGTTKGNAAENQALTGTAWRWSRTAGAWVLPRNLRPETRKANIDRFVTAAERAGLEVEVIDTGERLTVAEERAAELERLEARAERLDAYAAQQAEVAAAKEAAAKAKSDFIPIGQPILVDHYSARGHIRALEKIQKLTTESIEAERNAREAARLATGLERRVSEGTGLPTLLARIERQEAELRKVQREGRDATRLVEAIELDKAEVARREAADGVKVWGPGDFTKGDLVKVSSRWYVVQRVNAKTLTVPSTLGSWTDTVPYAKVRDRRPAPDA